jgi:hypothetical protein
MSQKLSEFQQYGRERPLTFSHHKKDHSYQSLNFYLKAHFSLKSELFKFLKKSFSEGC